MGSIWSETVTLPSRSALEGEHSTEVAVVGGGMAGVLTAWFLRKRGAKVLLLEADRLAGGQTRNTTAKITAQHGMIYERLSEQKGELAARQYASANQRAVEAYRRLVRERKIPCEWEDCPAFLYSTQEEDPVRQEAHTAARLGLECSFTLETELPFPVKGAARLERQARFHPLRFLGALAEELEVFEHSRVIAAEGGALRTERGRVKAEQVVFTTHYPFINVPGLYFLRMHQERSYVLALRGAARLKGMYYGTDPDGVSLRPCGDLLLLGGGKHRTGENYAGGRYRGLEEQAERLFPGASQAAHWSAQDCISMDGVPYIGPYASAAPNWYVATGFGKWGMTGSMVSALLLSGLLTGERDPDGAVFDPGRMDLRASAANLWEDGKQAVKGLCRSAFEPPRAAVEALTRGHGGIVEVEGEKLGVYKTEDGEVFTVSAHCPHLGCQVEWNPDEKTWDCPCHGSRFDFQGRLLDGPAQKGL